MAEPILAMYPDKGATIPMVGFFASALRSPMFMNKTAVRVSVHAAELLFIFEIIVIVPKAYPG
jgi:hypothetical protein